MEQNSISFKGECSSEVLEEQFLNCFCWTKDLQANKLQGECCWKAQHLVLVFCPWASQNHRMDWAGGILETSSLPPCCHGLGHLPLITQHTFRHTGFSSALDLLSFQGQQVFVAVKSLWMSHHVPRVCPAPFCWSIAFHPPNLHLNPVSSPAMKNKIHNSQHRNVIEVYF